ncbi:unnamed protein product, partial [Owenia fusiformis]
MSTRPKEMGDMRITAGKIASKYNADVERECLDWIQQLTEDKITPGIKEVEKQLKTGITLCKLVQAVYKGTAKKPPKAKKFKIKFNTMSAPFKQMENITVFLNACEAYGVPKNSLFQTVDLFEGRNMAQVMATILQLGTECQRTGFDGPTIGPRPTEKHIVEFSEEQLKAGQGIIGLQAGTNKCASQSGMAMGAVRHIADIKADDMSKDSQSSIGLQAGSNKGASQAGMSMGAVRHVSDIRADDMSKDSAGSIGLQAGSNKGASQAGMSMGAVRHVSDIRADDMSADSAGTIGLQMGSNKGASQAGMSMGAVRHVADIRADEMSADSAGTIGLQMGSNKGASQAGMAMGSVRHVADIKTEAGSAEG